MIELSEQQRREAEEAAGPISAPDALPLILFGFASWFLIAFSTRALSDLPLAPSLTIEQMLQGLLLIGYVLLWARDQRQPTRSLWLIPVSSLLFMALQIILLLYAEAMPFWTLASFAVFVSAGVYSWSRYFYPGMRYWVLALIISACSFALCFGTMLIRPPATTQTYGGTLVYVSAIALMLAHMSSFLSRSGDILEQALAARDPGELRALIADYLALRARRFRVIAAILISTILIPLTLRYLLSADGDQTGLWGSGQVLDSGRAPLFVAALLLSGGVAMLVAPYRLGRIAVFVLGSLPIFAMTMISPVLGIAVASLTAIAAMCGLGRESLFIAPGILFVATLQASFIDPEQAQLYSAMAMSTVIGLIVILALKLKLIKIYSFLALLASDQPDEYQRLIDNDRPLTFGARSLGVAAAALVLVQTVGVLVADPVRERSAVEDSLEGYLQDLSDQMIDRLSLIQFLLESTAQQLRSPGFTPADSALMSFVNDTHGRNDDLVVGLLLLHSDQSVSMLTSGALQAQQRERLRLSLAGIAADTKPGTAQDTLHLQPIETMNNEQIWLISAAVPSDPDGQAGSDHVVAVLSPYELLEINDRPNLHVGRALQVALASDDQAAPLFSSDGWNVADLASERSRLISVAGTDLKMSVRDNSGLAPLFSGVLNGILESLLLAACVGFAAYQYARHLIDQSLREEAEDALRESERQRELAATAEAANRAKSQFLANLSHEIRTPLNAIIASVNILRNSRDPQETEEYLDALNSGSNSLLMLVNDVLDITKVESGELVINQNDFSISRLMRELETLFSATARDKNVRLLFKQTDEDIPDWLCGDESHLRQILSNLISNALKFTPSGGRIEVITRNVGDGSQTRLQFEVSDNGIGIPEQAQKRIFEPFTQVDESDRRTHGGSGLGLALVKQISEACGGSTELESTPGAGTTLRVELPFEAPRSAPPAPVAEIQDAAAAPALQGLRIMIVDDTPLNLKIARRLVEKAGAVTDSAENGAEALEKIFPNPNAYHVILLDLQMPVMDGYETCQRLRANPATASLPVIAVTAAATLSDREAAFSAGVDAYQTKPIQIDALVREIRKLVPADALVAQG